MAIGRLSVKTGRTGRAGPHAAYIAREGQYIRYLERGEALEATDAGNLPLWAQHAPLLFWQAADAHERSNGTTYREMEIALPRELDAGQREDLVRAFVAQEIGDKHAYQWAIHTPLAADGKAQPHVHLMFSERQVDGIERDPEQYFKRYNAKIPEQGGARKGYGPHAGQTLSRSARVSDLKELRARWQDMANTHLQQRGHSARIHMKSHAERRTGIEPEIKQLPSQWRGAGRENVLEFRQARAELIQAQVQVQQTVPNVAAQIISLEAERARRTRLKHATPEHAHTPQKPAHTAEIKQIAAAGIARFRAKYEQDRKMAAEIEAGKQRARASFQRFKAEQQAQQRQAEQRQAEQAKKQAQQRKQARADETAEKIKQSQARAARAKDRDGPDWSR